MRWINRTVDVDKQKMKSVEVEEMADEFGRLKPGDSALILIDAQEKFVPHIFEIQKVIDNCVRLVKGCRELGVPIIVTEQYPEGLGHTVEPLKEALGEFKAFEKIAFSVFEDGAISAGIRELGKKNLILAGIEAHVCLIKSALDALAHGYSAHWIVDAVSSRTPGNVKAATRRAIQCGAFSSSTEMALFQMLSTAKDPGFRAISKIVK